MKKIILSVIVSFVAITTTEAQEQTYRYYPLSEFQGDTLEFLHANFFKQTHCFDGKSVLDVIDILEAELPVKQIFYRNWPDTMLLQNIELIFDDRKQDKIFNQLHFVVMKFSKEYTQQEMETILGIKPEQMIPLTQEVKQKLKQFTFDERFISTHFSDIKLTNWPISD
ncbi:hypothetical protein [Rikenella microfusus]|uniref:hypothetical protein n=1 Tax=Rikenella microfusus TaxID=28139 RepID=UPI00248EFE57|nr:hypothetical protein [Rikenella microfusus]